MKGTRSPFIAIIACIAAIILGANSASAAVTIKSQPTAAFSGASVTVSGGSFSGLGSIPTFGLVTATGQAIVTQNGQLVLCRSYTSTGSKTGTAC